MEKGANVAHTFSVGDICRLGGIESLLAMYMRIREYIHKFYGPHQVVVILYGGSAFKLLSGNPIEDCDIDIVVVVNTDAKGSNAIWHHLAHVIIPFAVMDIKTSMDAEIGIRDMMETAYSEASIGYDEDLCQDIKTKKQILTKMYEREKWINSHHITLKDQIIDNDDYRRLYIRHYNDIYRPKQPRISHGYLKSQIVQRSPVYVTINQTIKTFSLTRLRWRSSQFPNVTTSLMDISITRHGTDIDRAVVESGWWLSTTNQICQNTVIVSSPLMCQNELKKMLADTTISDDRKIELSERLIKVESMIRQSTYSLTQLFSVSL